MHQTCPPVARPLCFVSAACSVLAKKGTCRRQLLDVTPTTVLEEYTDVKIVKTRTVLVSCNCRSFPASKIDKIFHTLKMKRAKFSWSFWVETNVHIDRWLWCRKKGEMLRSVSFVFCGWAGGDSVSAQFGMTQFLSNKWSWPNYATLYNRGPTIRHQIQTPQQPYRSTSALRVWDGAWKHITLTLLKVFNWVAWSDWQLWPASSLKPLGPDGDLQGSSKSDLQTEYASRLFQTNIQQHKIH